jgi:hypothetical protein
MPRKKKPVTKQYTAAEIVKLVDDKENSQAFSDLRDQMDSDFDLFSLEEEDEKTGHQSYTTPRPKNDFKKVLASVNKAELTWRIAVPEKAPEEERQAASKGEQILTGMIAQADRKLKQRGEPVLREGLGWFGCGRGVGGLRCLIYTPEGDDTETVTDIRHVDPMQMTWEDGLDGMAWANIKYTITETEANDRWGDKVGEIKGDTNREVKVYDFFTKKINAIVITDGDIEGTEAKFVKKPEDHGLDHVPLWKGFAGSMPTVYRKEGDSTPTLKYRASSVWDASRGIYKPFNNQIGFIMDTAEKSVAGTLVYASEDGKKQIEGNPFENYKVILTKYDKESLLPLETPKVPPESAVLMNIFDRDLQASTVPYPIGYGIDTQAHSGAALSMMNDNMRSIYDPYCNLVADGFRWLCEEIFSQFKQKGQKMVLKGYNNNKKFFTLDVSPDDIEDDWYVVVTCEPKMPRDQANEITMAKAATDPGPDGIPLMSKLTAREDIIHLQDPDAERERITEEKIRSLIDQNPNLALQKQALALIEKGDKWGALALLGTTQDPLKWLKTLPPEAQNALIQEAMGKGAIKQTAPVPTSQGMPQGTPVGSGATTGGQSIPPQVAQELQQLSQRLGIPPDKLAQMQPDEINALLARQQGGQ